MTTTLDAMEFLYKLFVISLMLSEALLHKTELELNHNASEKYSGKKQQQRPGHDFSLLANADAAANFGDHKKTVIQMYELDTYEFFRHLNATIYGGTSLNYSKLNSSFGYGEGFGCAPSQSSLIYLLNMILYSIVCIVGLLGNTLVIYVVLRFSKMQTVTNIYILNLAIADECFLIGIPFLLYTMRSGRWSFGEYACKAYMVSTSITQFTSSIFLLIMSADRYIAVCHPISSPRYRTPTISKMVTGIAWLTSVLLMLPVILFANAVTIDDHTTCNIEWPESRNTQSGTTFILYSLVLGFATPLTFILGFYCLVIRKLHAVGRKHKSKGKKRSHRKVTRLVLTVITVYILCWLPYWISQVALITSSDHCMSRLEITIFLLVSCLGYSNSAMNPLLYAFLSDNFKKSFMKACTCSNQKDMNVQLQLENNVGQRVGKTKVTENMKVSSGKGMEKKSILSQASKPKLKSSSSSDKTNCCNTTMKVTSYSVVPMESSQQNNFLALPSNTEACSSSFGSASSNNQLIVPGNVSTATDNSVVDNTSEYSDNMGKPPVLHTDL